MVVSNQKRGIGVFPNHQETESALNELKESGFSMENVSIIAKQAEQEKEISEVEMSDRVGEQDVKSPTGVVGDALTSATWGSLLVGLTSLSILGAGPILAAGALGVSLVTGLAGVGLGVVGTNKLIDALTDLGIPKEQARVYSDSLLQGDYLVILEGTDDQMDKASNILSDRGIHHWGVYDAPQN
ncbi:general stress protein [Pleurocapsales cyanobacterium LEGE 06147]|nr:general stress protein [Pleurocapsales cyanobacterium LEGE 06147]